MPACKNNDEKPAAAGGGAENQDDDDDGVNYFNEKGAASDSVGSPPPVLAATTTPSSSGTAAAAAGMIGASQITSSTVPSSPSAASSSRQPPSCPGELALEQLLIDDYHDDCRMTHHAQEIEQLIDDYDSDRPAPACKGNNNGTSTSTSQRAGGIEQMMDDDEDDPGPLFDVEVHENDHDGADDAISKKTSLARADAISKKIRDFDLAQSNTKKYNNNNINSKAGGGGNINEPSSSSSTSSRRRPVVEYCGGNESGQEPPFHVEAYNNGNKNSGGAISKKIMDYDCGGGVGVGVTNRHISASVPEVTEGDDNNEDSLPPPHFAHDHGSSSAEDDDATTRKNKNGFQEVVKKKYSPLPHDDDDDDDESADDADVDAKKRAFQQVKKYSSVEYIEDDDDTNNGPGIVHYESGHDDDNAIKMKSSFQQGKKYSSSVEYIEDDESKNDGPGAVHYEAGHDDDNAIKMKSSFQQGKKYSSVEYIEDDDDDTSNGPGVVHYESGHEDESPAFSAKQNNFRQGKTKVYSSSLETIDDRIERKKRTDNNTRSGKNEEASSPSRTTDNSDSSAMTGRRSSKDSSTMEGGRKSIDSSVQISHGVSEENPMLHSDAASVGEITDAPTDVNIVDETLPTAKLVEDDDDDDRDFDDPAIIYQAEEVDPNDKGEAPPVPCWKRNKVLILSAACLVFIGITTVSVAAEILSIRNPISSNGVPTMSPTLPPLPCNYVAQYLGPLFEEGNGAEMARADGYGAEGESVVAIAKNNDECYWDPPIIHFLSIGNNSGTFEDAAPSRYPDHGVSGMVFKEDWFVVSDPFGWNGGTVHVSPRDAASGEILDEMTTMLTGGDPSGQFGYSIAMDGDLLVTGAPNDVNEENLAAGTAFIFRRINETSWSEGQKLHSPNNDTSVMNFGASVLVRNETVFVAADHCNTTGKVFAYTFDSSSNLWRVNYTIENDDCDERFGSSLAFVGDGLMIGCSMDNNENGDAAGAVYYYEESGDDYDDNGHGPYHMVQKIIAQDGEPMRLFGGNNHYLAVSENDTLVAIGTYSDEGINETVHIFGRFGNLWREMTKIDAPDDAIDNFGHDVVFLGDRILISSWSNVYTYRLTCSDVAADDFNGTSDTSSLAILASSSPSQSTSPTQSTSPSSQITMDPQSLIPSHSHTPTFNGTLEFNNSIPVPSSVPSYSQAPTTLNDTTSLKDSFIPTPSLMPTRNQTPANLNDTMAFNNPSTTIDDTIGSNNNSFDMAPSSVPSHSQTPTTLNDTTNLKDSFIQGTSSMPTQNQTPANLNDTIGSNKTFALVPSFMPSNSQIPTTLNDTVGLNNYPYIPGPSPTPSHSQIPTSPNNTAVLNNSYILEPLITSSVPESPSQLTTNSIGASSKAPSSLSSRSQMPSSSFSSPTTIPSLSLPPSIVSPKDPSISTQETSSKTPSFLPSLSQMPYSSFSSPTTRPSWSLPPSIVSPKDPAISTQETEIVESDVPLRKRLRKRKSVG